MTEVPASLYTHELPRAPGCKCNDYQLSQVGCDCGAEQHNRSYFDGNGRVSGHAADCEHVTNKKLWVEVNDEPPYDICSSCGARRD